MESCYPGLTPSLSLAALQPDTKLTEKNKARKIFVSTRVYRLNVIILMFLVVWGFFPFIYTFSQGIFKIKG